MKDEMNYRPLIVDTFEDLLKKGEEYTLGELIYNILTQVSKAGNEIKTKADVRNITDQEFYTGISRTLTEYIGDEPIN